MAGKCWVLHCCCPGRTSLAWVMKIMEEGSKNLALSTVSPIEVVLGAAFS